jgi:NADPH:quinone reductase-like Zn-dependent oxidoreductase
MTEQTYVPEKMQALHLPPGPYDEKTPPNASSLIYDTGFPVPTPAPTEYLIKVQTAVACAGELTSRNILSDGPVTTTTTTTSQTDKEVIPAHEFCGQVISTPTEDQFNSCGPKFKVGSDVFGLLSYDRLHGAAADYVLATERELAFKPQNVSAAEAATVPLAALTAWQAFFGHAGLDPDDGSSNRPADRPLRVLVTNASDEIGSYAIQLLRSRTLFPEDNSHLMGGMKRGEAVWICAMAPRDELDFIRKELGVDAVTASTDIAAAFRENGWDPVDIVFECMGGGATLRQVHSPVVVRDQGHVLSICRPPSAHPDRPAEQDTRAEIQSRRLYSELVIAKPSGNDLTKIAHLVEKGDLKPSTRNYEVVDLLGGRDAMVRAEKEKGAKGKVILKVDPAINTDAMTTI